MKYHLKDEFPPDIYVPAYTAKQMAALEERRRVVLSGLLREKKTTWPEIFAISDIGAERNMIAERFVPDATSVLDVGCGRGFFSFACAKRAERVTCLDSMDGGGRAGWWGEFLEASRLLRVGRRVLGARASAARLPFGKGCFDLVASVHALRNFRDEGEIKSFFLEAKRVLKRKGHAVLVESDLEDRNCRAYRAFYSLRTRAGWELKLPSLAKMVESLKGCGFSRVSSRSLDTDLKYAPVYFPFNRLAMKGMETSYNDARRLLIEEGERHPPILIVRAVR